MEETYNTSEIFEDTAKCDDNSRDDVIEEAFEDIDTNMIITPKPNC